MDEQSQKRSNRRRRRQRRSPQGTLLRIIGVLALIIVVFFGVKIFNGRKEPGTTMKITRTASDLPASAAELKKNTFLVAGIKSDGGKDVLTGLLEFVVDDKKETIGGIIVPTNTFVDVAGRGFEPIADGYSEDMVSINSTMESFIGVKARGYVIVDDALFLDAVREGNIKRLLDGRRKTDLDEREVKDLSSSVNKVTGKDVSLIDLPVRPISFGEATYFDTKRDELARLTSMFWRVKLVRNDGKIRIILLNGNGAPGVARKAADGLLGKGYKIVDIKNADNFNYAVTQIVVYNDKKSEDAWEIRKVLDRGVIKSKNTPQDVADVVIILGKDYN